MRKDVSGKVELAVRPLPYSETWRPTPPDKPGVWWMLAGECEGEPDLVRVDRRRGELWAIDCAVGSLQVKMYNDGLTDCMWQEAQRIAKGRDAALSRRVPLERRVGRQNVTTE